MNPQPFGNDDIELTRLRRRTSAKWRAYPDDVLPLWVAEMDFPVAEPIAAALHDAVSRSDLGYRWSRPVVDALVDYASAHHDWSIDPRRVIPLADVMSAVAEALRALTSPGEGVVINAPVYPPFHSTVEQVTGRRLVDVPIEYDGTRWCVDLARLEEAFRDPEVTAYLLCNPHNPTGATHTAAHLAAIGELARRHGVTVIADEIHAPLALPGSRHVPYLAAVGDPGTDVAVVSASKGWNLPALKCAQLVAGSAETAARLAAAVPIEATYGVGHFGVIAGAVAYRDGQEWLRRAIATVDANRQLLAELLAARLPDVGFHQPEATYLAWLDLRALRLGDDPAAALLERGRVALSPGSAFGRAGDGWARLNLATSPAIIREAVDRIGTVADSVGP